MPLRILIVSSTLVLFLTIGISRFLLLKRKLFKWKKILGEELLEESLNEKEHPKEISEE